MLANVQMLTNTPKQVVDTMLLDWSPITLSALHRVTADGYAQAQLDKGRKVGSDILTEVTYQVARTIMLISASLNPKKFIFALDSKPYWRSPIITDYYYDVINLLWNPWTSEWLADVEGKSIYAKQDTGVGRWDSYPMSKQKFKDQFAVEAFENLVGMDQWFYFEGGILTDEDHERLAAVYGQPAVERSAKVYESLLGGGLYANFYDEYKAGRKWAHEAICTKEQFQERFVKVAKVLASIVGGYVVSVEGAEADDVVATYCKIKHPEQSVGIYTVDKDLAQLIAHYENVHLFTRNGVWKSHDGSRTEGLELVYHETNRDKELYNYLLKIVGGDTSDKIKGCRKSKQKKDGSYETATTVMAETGADKWLSQYRHNWEENKVKFLDQKSLEKNTTLVDLRKCPAGLVDKIASDLSMWEACEPHTPAVIDGTPITFADFGISDLDWVEFDSVIQDNNPLYLSVVQGIELPVVIAESPVVSKPAKYIITVQAHPTNPAYPSWSAGVYEALSEDEAMEQVKLALPAEHSALISKQGNGWYWWECQIDAVTA